MKSATTESNPARALENGSHTSKNCILHIDQPPSWKVARAAIPTKQLRYPNLSQTDTDGPSPNYSPVSLPHHSAQVYRFRVLASQPVAATHQTRGEAHSGHVLGISPAPRIHDLKKRELWTFFEGRLSPIISTGHVTHQAPCPTRLIVWKSWAREMSL